MSLPLPSFRPFLLALAGCGLLLLAGCINLDPETRPVRTYVLTPVIGEADPSVAEPGLGLYVRRVDLPGYLKTARLVARAEGNRLESSPYAVWAEPLDEGMARVVALNLGQAFNTDRIGYYPWRPTDGDAYFIRLQVVRLDLSPRSPLQLTVRWSVTRGEAGPEVAAGSFAGSRAIEGAAGPGDRVAALDQLIGDLSADIAAAHGAGGDASSGARDRRQFQDSTGRPGPAPAE